MVSPGEPTVAEQHASSPASTGGAGVFFEQHVGAYWLAQLLVGSIPPVFLDTVVAAVHFQTEHLKWRTDDFLIVCRRADGTARKLPGQVKRSFTVSVADEDCVKAIGDFWADFNASDRFSPSLDRLLLVTLRGTNVLLQDFVGLLDCARAARDGLEFEQRLAIDGFISKKAVKYCGELRKIVGDIQKRPMTGADLWPFLRVLHLVSLDLDSATGQTEAHVKSLLAHTVREGDAVAAADTSWNELLAVAGTAMKEARSFNKVDLPEVLRNRHDAVGTNDHRVLRTLKEHADVVLDGVRATIGGDFHLQRVALVHEVLAKLESVRVVIISGPAGSGKSVVAKDAAELMRQDHFTFAFRVEEFAQPHFSATLAAAQVPVNAKTLGAILAAQDRKVVLVESVERLLERTTREAFGDLMRLVTSDGGMRIILTCRDYSVEQVRASFLQPARIKCDIVRVPTLDDMELAQIEDALPALRFPLQNPALRDVLRNPFFLDKALEITWSAEKPVPQSEREFRSLFWREIVRADHRVPAGMGRRREGTLEEIAVRRARALSAFIVCNALDPEVVESLRRDSLINSQDSNPQLVATAHDVLEDWAILQWLEEQQLTADASFAILPAVIGTHPALRRCYRRWVAELIERDGPAADRLFREATSGVVISPQFRDDTLVSFLRAPSSPEFLARIEAQLLANGRALLKRIIHLLRVACVKAPDWAGGAPAYGSTFNVPDGAAWSTVLSFVHRDVANFALSEHGLLLGLIEDAIRGVSWFVPDVQGADFIAGIAHFLLAAFNDYSEGEPRKRVLKVLARIPKADPIRFEKALWGDAGDATEAEQHDYIADDFRQLIFMGTDGMAAARDVPDVVVSVGTEYLLANEKDIRDRYSRFEMDLGMRFGIKEGLDMESFPASALRGPWLHLLRYHRAKGLDFVIGALNHSADWYAHPRVPFSLEPPSEVEVVFADGSTRKQWANPRLWGLYRNMSVGPHVLKSLLMALEKWLLELASNDIESLDTVLVEILRRSESAALAAVVASVATAYPHGAGESLLVLLSAPAYLSMDHSRKNQEASHAAFSATLSTSWADHEPYELERNEGNGLPHRGEHLETAILKLQFGPLGVRVQGILDRHLQSLPPKGERDESALIWQLAINRMDLRQYAVSEKLAPQVAPSEEEEPAKPYVRLDPMPADPDIQAMVDANKDRLSAMNARHGLWLWGLRALQREHDKFDPSEWGLRLNEARAMGRDATYSDGSENGPGVVAAVCVRDHFEEMPLEQREWAVDLVCSEVLRGADRWAEGEGSHRLPTDADRASASVIALVLDGPLPEPQIARVRQAFAAALTHPSDEVRWRLIWSIDEAFWAKAAATAWRCVNAIATQAECLEKAFAADWKRQQRQQRQQRGSQEIVAEAATLVRSRFWQEGAIASDAYRSIDIAGRFGADASMRALAILGRVPNDPLAIAEFARAGITLLEWWNSDKSEPRRDRNYGIELKVSEHLQEFLMRTSAESAREVLVPMLDAAIEDHTDELQSIVQGLTAMQDRNANTPQYWLLWGLFADAAKGAKWVSRLDDRYGRGSDLLSALFLTSGWKSNVRHWTHLDGYVDRVHSLFEGLPPTSVVLDHYANFLYHIGERSLPEALVRVATSLQRGNARRMLAKTNTVFVLEVLLQRHVYGRPLELKRNSDIRSAVVALLDLLVEQGSSAAFRMRDDFVTPAA